MRYQVPVIVTVRAYGPDEAKRIVQRLVDEAPTAHHVNTQGLRFAVGDAAEHTEVREDVTWSVSAEERTIVQRALDNYRAE